MTPPAVDNHEWVATRLIARCRELDLPVWRWDAYDDVVANPTEWEGADAWLASPALRDLMVTAALGWRRTPSPPVTELFPGGWLIPLVDEHDGERQTLVALALGPELFDNGGFEAICQTVELDAAAARAALVAIARHRRPDMETKAKVLRWMCGDLRRDADHHYAIDNFSKQLVDVYEQMNLLYRVGELMNGLEDPSGFVRVACDLLHTTLEFEWVAVRFTSLTALGPTMANDLVLVGTPPCSHTRYDKLAGELALSSTPDDRPLVLTPCDSSFAELVASEVFVNPLICDGEVAGLLIAGNKEGPDPDVSTIDMQLLSATADYLSAYLHNAAMYNEQRTTLLGIIKALSASIDAKDRYTRGHSERVAHVASDLARATGMSEDQVERVRLAGILHDMGKIGVPEAVLLKPGRLTEEEFAAIKLHPTIGYNILKDIEPLQDVLPGVLYHHERWDGGGYPHGLRGESIPLIGRILAVADAFDAMSSDRAYRPRIERDKVLREMRDGAGAQWDAELIRLFLTIDLDKYDAMIARHAAQDSIAA